jgi:glycosidase
MIRILSAFLILCYSLQAEAQPLNFYPSHWWVGMKNKELQIMIHAKDVGKTKKCIFKEPGIQVKKIHPVENKDYLFIDLVLSAQIKPGLKKGMLIHGKDSISFEYELKKRNLNNGIDYAKGVTSKDFIYLIMPDRFSNGDLSNDRIPGMMDQSLRRDTVYNRHGGDLQGIINHLDYLKDLGVTTIWLNPVLENNMPERTEHGYAITDHYKVDPRLGGNSAYRKLVDKAHENGMKIIQDAIYNHVGSKHFTVTDAPMKDWLNQWPSYTNTNYKEQPLFDSYASKKDKTQMSDGWFTKEMPDLNQRNPFVALFLIQHAIWCVEEFGIDGWRIDTYAYNDLNFMNRCNAALMSEFPSISIFGETWVHGVPNQSYFCENNINTSFKSNLPGATDFQALWGITDAMTKPFGWTDGVNKLYNTLTQDFLYKDPMRNVVFLDNHDISRFFSVIGSNKNKYKSSLSWLLTTRGIPQIYYTSEFATTGVTNPNDGLVRLDFPGGWKEDSINKFIAKGRSETDEEIFQHIRTLANFRKKSTALQTGKFMQYIPVDGLYIYFRYDKNQTILVALNTGTKSITIHPEDYTERTAGFKSYRSIFETEIHDLRDITLEPEQSLVLELIK